MSLGSKELFHSNFLEYLFTIDRESFIQMINDFNLKDIELRGGVNYQIGREVENFDLCIYHTVNGNESEKKIYDLVIENKVKSIPYKTQLEDYVTKACKKSPSNCKFILLTLSDEFPDKDNLTCGNGEKWEVINYETLEGGINDHYLNHISDKNQSYIKDYCYFIEQLNNLRKYLIPKQGQPLFDKNIIKRLKEYRLHDLYIKLRCSWFAVELNNLLKNLKVISIPTKFINKYEEREYQFVNINIAINQGNGQIAAWICDRDRNTFEVVIQGNQYRHGINQVCINTQEQVRTKRLNELYTRLQTPDYTRSSKFLDFQDEFSIGTHLTQPDIKKNHRKNNPQDPVVLKSGPFNCYGDSYIYRYREIDDIAIEQLLEWMVKDIKDLYSNIPKLN